MNYAAILNFDAPLFSPLALRQTSTNTSMRICVSNQQNWSIFALQHCGGLKKRVVIWFRQCRIRRAKRATNDLVVVREYCGIWLCTVVHGRQRTPR